MSSKRRLRRRSCEQKRRYGSAHHAKRARRAADPVKFHGVHPYHCQFCGGWHLGH